MVRCALLALLLVGCRSDHDRATSKAQPATTVHVELRCPDETRTLDVKGDIALDEKLCDEPVASIEVEGGSRIARLPMIEHRDVWLRRAPDRAFVEVRSGDKVTDTYDRVTTLLIHAVDEPQVAPKPITITHGGVTEQVDARELRRKVAEHGVREVSLCEAADLLAGPKHGPITVYGESPQPTVITAEQCRARGLLLKFASQGAVRLRQKDGTRIYSTVTRLDL